MTRRVHRLLATLLGLVTLGGLAACGDDGASSADKLTIYSGRQEALVGKLIARFETASGVDTEVRYGDSAELAATLAEEGDNSPADVFFSQDAGALGAVENEGLLRPLPAGPIAAVPARFRDPRGQWVGVSGRSRVVAYNTDELSEAKLPDSVFDYAKPAWKGRVGIAPPNASFQAFVSAMRITAGDARAKRFLEDLKRNDVQTFENNIAILEAIASGEIDVGLVNHYYLAEVKRERPDAPVKNRFLRAGDPGSLVNAAGVGVLRSADSVPAAQRFVRFLLSPEGQRYFVSETDEYPLVPGIEPPRDVPPLSEVHGPDIRLGQLGAKLQSTLELIDQTGLGG